MDQKAPSKETYSERTSEQRPTTILIAALGGEGGGVLSTWLANVAESEGWIVQTTSIPGVAQRTGATTYYIEIFPKSAASDPGKEPVMALTPNPGDIDLLVASEIIETGRMAQRGFIHPDRTTVICSDHRVFAIGEKSAMGDGAADKTRVINAVDELSKRFIHFDMMKVAQDAGTIINAVLLGAVAGSGALSFDRATYENAIKEGGIAVESNLNGFSIGYDLARGKTTSFQKASETEAANKHDTGASDTFSRQIGEKFPAPAQHILTEGVKRLIDYQGPSYVQLYLDRLETLQNFEQGQGAEHDFKLTSETGRYLALWMSFEDIIRVADLKVRAARFERIEKDAKIKPDQLYEVYEFLKPRPEEMVSIFPPKMAKFLLRTQPFKASLNFFSKGRQVNTTSIPGFLFMRAIAALKGWRPNTWRYKEEQQLIERWLDYVRDAAADDYRLGIEVARCGRLIKGYGDTHERGVRNFDLIMGRLEKAKEDDDGASIIAKLREAAMADEDGKALDAAMTKLS